MQNLKLSTEWDKTFPKSEKVNHRKITFHNRYGITLAADMRRPWRNAAFSQSHLTRHLREKAAVS